MQKYTSTNTSINSIKLPALFNRVSFSPNTHILDYGCGKHTLHIAEHVHAQNCIYVPYDPYNKPEATNKAAYKLNAYDVVTCSNVLNVIMEHEIQLDIIKDVHTLLCTNGTAYFTVYEGNKSGIGKVSKADCWQENKRTADYIGLCKEVFEDVEIKNNVIICKK